MHTLGGLECYHNCFICGQVCGNYFYITLRKVIAICDNLVSRTYHYFLPCYKPQIILRGFAVNMGPCGLFFDGGYAKNVGRENFISVGVFFGEAQNR